MSTDQAWVKWGEKDPYFAVITHPKYRAGALDDKAREEFFQSGQRHVRYVLDTCNRYVAPGFRPRRILDFGCGVGRVILPFAQLEGVERAVGVDVSPAMLEEARRNQAIFGVDKLELLPSDDRLSAVAPGFDLVHSFIVFQHIDPPRGRAFFARLLELLEPGGIAAIQVLYGKAYHADRFGQAPSLSRLPGLVEPMMPTGLRGWLLRLWRRHRRRKLPAMEATSTATAPMADPDGDPEMQMNPYNLSELLFLLQQAGIRRMHAELTDHGGELGAFLFFQKPAAA